MARSQQLLVLGCCLSLAAGQCGPDKSKPYPPGQTTCPSGPPPGGGTGPPAGGQPGGGTSTFDCSSFPCAAPLLGDVGLTTASGRDSRTGRSFAAGENIFGPFEAGFSSQQDGILQGLGCNPGSLGHVAGGIDTQTAEQMVAQQCGITLPRIEGSSYISLLDECGGHTNEYHFHEKMGCLYTADTSTGHSTQVGKGSDGRLIFGKWETSTDLPLLDACGGHFGVTPDSGGQVVYHYHVQDKPPFTIGCYGPKVADNGAEELVTLAECRQLYDGCGNGDTFTASTPAGDRAYDPWCPCYDADNSNVGTKELPVFSPSAANDTVLTITGSGSDSGADSSDTGADGSDSGVDSSDTGADTTAELGAGNNVTSDAQGMLGPGRKMLSAGLAYALARYA